MSKIQVEDLFEKLIYQVQVCSCSSPQNCPLLRLQEGSGPNIKRWLINHFSVLNRWKKWVFNSSPCDSWLVTMDKESWCHSWGQVAARLVGVCLLVGSCVGLSAGFRLYMGVALAPKKPQTSPWMPVLGSKGVGVEQFFFLYLSSSLGQRSSLLIELMIGSSGSEMTAGPGQGRVLLFMMQEALHPESQGVAHILGFGKAWWSDPQVWLFSD